MPYLKLPANYVDPETQTPMPDAVLVIEDCEFRMRAGDTRVQAQIYSSSSVINVAKPEREFPIVLSIAERDTQLPGLLEALYAVVGSRDEYAGSTLVP